MQEYIKGNAIIKVYRPTLTEAVKALRTNSLENALNHYGKAVKENEKKICLTN